MKFLTKQGQKMSFKTLSSLGQSKNLVSRKKKAHEASIIRHAQTTHHWKKGEGKFPNKSVKVILWNVNGYRAVKQKGELQNLFTSYNSDTDFFCFNETKIDFEKYSSQALIKNLSIKQAEDYNEYWNFCKVSRGYSGVMTFSKHLPLKVIEDMPEFEQHNKEGRIITLEFDKFFLVNLYKPNAGDQLIRLPYRLQYEDCFRQYIKKLQQQKPVIIVGDMNVANEQIDLRNPKANEGKACFTIEQRTKFKQLLSQCNLSDSFRQLHPSQIKYSFWSYRRNARLTNAGWRLDYILVDKRLAIKKAQILDHIYGSDHCPVMAEIQLQPQENK